MVCCVSLAVGLAIVSLILLLIFAIFGDGDLNLLYHDKLNHNIDKLKGKVIWITGASSGIGAACALEAIKLGAKVVISARSEDLLEGVKKICLASNNEAKEDDVLLLRMDVNDVESHQKNFDKILSHFGQLDVMVHNAGKYQRGRFEHTDISVDKDVFDLNVFSLVNLTRVIIPYFERRGKGSFAIMSSLAGKSGVPFSAAYCASKHAIQGYFESLRAEKIGTGIKVTMICPGPVTSNILKVGLTEKPNETLGDKAIMIYKHMTAERCARLCLVGIANDLEEIWISFSPPLLLSYLNQYFPTTWKRIFQIIGPSYMKKVQQLQEKMEAKAK